MSTNAVYGVIIAVLILLSGFFSCVETAFSCANTIRLKALADNGSRRAKNALWVTDRFDNVLTAILIGNNVVNLGCSSLATILCLSIPAGTDLRRGHPEVHRQRSDRHHRPPHRLDTQGADLSPDPADIFLCRN